MITPIVVMDGLWFCIRKSMFDEICFDSLNYSGFHYYDIDISMQIILSGFKIVALPDIDIYHCSSGQINTQWLRNAFVFSNKYNKNLPVFTRSISESESLLIEKQALYSSLKLIFKFKEFKLIRSWFIFASNLIETNYYYAIVEVLKYHFLNKKIIEN